MPTNLCITTETFHKPSAPTPSRSVNLKAPTGICHRWLQGKLRLIFFSLQENAPEQTPERKLFLCQKIEVH